MKPLSLPKLLQASKGRPCVRCNRQDGTVVRAHYTGLRQHSYGKGKGIKGSDHISADLCRECHEFYDRPQQRKNVDASEEFLHYCMMSLWRDFEEGIIK